MRTISIALAIATLAAVATPTPSEAFGVRIGPFYFGIPFAHRRHVGRLPEPRTAALHDEAQPGQPGAAPAQPNRGPNQDPPPQIVNALLDPALALPAVYDGVFWPATSSPLSAAWPFSYEAIFQAAFAKRAQTAGACAPPGNANVVVGRIQATVRPNAAQLKQMQQLGGALAMAGQYLAMACPKDIPNEPTARMQMMEWQIEKLAQALDIVRPPLAEFQQSLSNDQRARFAAAAPATTGSIAAGNATHSPRSRTLSATPPTSSTAIARRRRRPTRWRGSKRRKPASTPPGAPWWRSNRRSPVSRTV